MEEKARKAKEKLKILGLKRKLEQVRKGKGNDMNSWVKKDCETYLQFKKRKTDSKMPTSLEGLRARCVEWQHRPSPCPSDMEDMDDDEEEREMSKMQAV